MGIKHMREKELLELLSQYESEERFGLPAASKQWSDVSFYIHIYYKKKQVLCIASLYKSYFMAWYLLGVGLCSMCNMNSYT